MSILSSFFHKEVEIKPNEIHNVAENSAADGTKIYTPGSILSAEAKRRKEALASGSVKPALAYSEEEQVPVNGINEETPHGVESKLEMKEEYPLG